MITRMYLILMLIFFCSIGFAQEENKEGWIALWDGETTKDWKASENPDSFSIKDGTIKVKGPRAHLFYVGPL